MVGRVLAAAVPAAVHSMRNWVLARALGLVGYVALTALVATGLWLRHPWRRGPRLVPAAALLRAHAALAAAAGVLIVGHVVFLAIDGHAHVGWAGALIPGRSRFRPLPVALGTYALYLGAVVAATASPAGTIVGRWWLPIHKLAAGTFRPGGGPRGPRRKRPPRPAGDIRGLGDRRGRAGGDASTRPHDRARRVGEGPVTLLVSERNRWDVTPAGAGTAPVRHRRGGRPLCSPAHPRMPAR